MDNILITNLTNIKYLTGFSGTYGYLLILGGERYLFTDCRYYERARQETRGVKVRLIKDNWPEVLLRYKIKELGFEANSVSYATYMEWRKKIKLVPTRNVIEKIRQIKKPEEIKKIKRAIRITKEVLSKINLKPGITELELADWIERLIRETPRAEPSFPTIVAFGTNSSVPHARPSNRRLRKKQIALIDLGVKIDGYSSDLTRTFWVGRISKKFQEVYNIVLTAQHLAIEGIRPGRAICEIDSIARDYIKRCGYGRYFGHSLGHGIGLDVHELPKINYRNNERLQEGMVFSVEPGIYIPGWGGVRIEDLVLVTKDGCEVLTNDISK